jgi:hypothetical protein
MYVAGRGVLWARECFVVRDGMGPAYGSWVIFDKGSERASERARAMVHHVTEHCIATIDDW